MSFINLDNIKEKEIVPGFLGKMVHSDHMTFVFWKIKTGASLPEHSHPNEQITTVIKGAFELTVDADTRMMKPGDVAIIPANVKHKGKSMTNSDIIDAFYPSREDYR